MRRSTKVAKVKHYPDRAELGGGGMEWVAYDEHGRHIGSGSDEDVARMAGERYIRQQREREDREIAAMRNANPEWPVVAAIVATTFVVSVGIAALALRKRKATDKDIYYYWADEDTSGWSTVYVPKIQNARTAEVFELEGTNTEQGALWDAQDEIQRRGGVAHQGRPVTSNPIRRSSSLRARPAIAGIQNEVKKIAPACPSGQHICSGSVAWGVWKCCGKSPRRQFPRYVS